MLFLRKYADNKKKFITYITSILAKLKLTSI